MEPAGRRDVLIRAFVSSFLMLAVVTAVAAGECTSQMSEVPFKVVDNRVIVSTFINDKGPYDFMLDTGAGSGASVSMEVFKTSHLRPLGRGVDTGAGEAVQETVEAVAKNVRIGPVRLGDIHVNGIDLRTPSEAIGFSHLDGIIGNDLFRRFVVMLDFRRRVMHLCAPSDFMVPSGPEAVPFTIYKDTIPMVDGSLEGIRGRFWIDLGDRYSLSVLGPFWRAHALDQRLPPPREALTGFGIGGPIHGLVTRVSDLRFGGVRVARVVARLSLQKGGWLADPDVAANIGMGVLRRFLLVIDYPHERFFFLNPTTETAADRYDRAGMWIGNVGRQPIILNVMRDGPAAEAGLHRGDRVRAIDGRPLSALGVLALREKLQDPGRARVLVQVQRGARTLSKVVTLRDLI